MVSSQIGRLFLPSHLYLAKLYDWFYIRVVWYISLEYLGVGYERGEKRFDGIERVVAHDDIGWLSSWLRATHTVFDGHTLEG